MKILYYSPHPNLNLTDPAGYGTHMREMIQAFRDQGHEVRPLIMGGTEPRENYSPPRNGFLKKIAKKIIPTARWQTWKDDRLIDFDEEAFLRLRAEIQKFKPDLIYERANYMQVSGVRAAKKAGVMHILEMNSPYVEEKVELEGGGSKLLQEAVQREHEQLTKTAQVMVVSSALRDYFIEHHGIFRGKFTVVPNAIDPAKTMAEPQAVLNIRQRQNLVGKVVFGWVGSIQPWHGIEKMIKAFAPVHRLHPDTRLLIVGSGETEGQLKALVQSMGLDDSVLFTGYVPHSEVFQHIAAMDICLLPNTNWYCSPIKLFEYGAMGKAIITTDHPAILDVMTPDVDGLIIDKSDEKALEEAMLKLVQDKETREKLAIGFQSKVLNHHTWKSNADRVLGYLKSTHASIPRS
jgi:glycosyltransferase involved in cell wall biosynthesis